MIQAWAVSSSAILSKRIAISVALQFVIYAWILLISPAFDFHSVAENRPLALVIVLLLVNTFLHLWTLNRLLAGPSKATIASWVIGVGILMRLVMLISTPIQEVDIYRYMWDGIVTNEGCNPFRYPPRQILDAFEGGGDLQVIQLQQLAAANEGIRDTLERVHFPELPTVYPPTSQFVFAAISSVIPSPSSVETRLLLFKLGLGLFDIGAMVCIWRLLVVARMHLGWLVVYAWSPLILKEFSNSGHLDSIAVCLTGAASLCLLVGARQRVAWKLILSAVLAGLAVGAKLYPIVLFPIWATYILKRIHLRFAFTWSIVAATSCVFALAPMVMSAHEETIKNPMAASLEIQDSQNLAGLTTFLAHWEINDLIFMVVEENLRPDGQIQGQPRLWFVFTPNGFRQSLTHLAYKLTGIDPLRLPFLVTRATTGCVFIVLQICFCLLVYRNAERVLEFSFLILAWFWLLAPTQNPWYWTWAVFFVPFSRNRLWLVMSGLTLIYYFRFWFLYHGGEVEVFGTPLRGVQFFDFVIVFLEFGPFLLLLTLSSLRSWRSGQDDLEAVNSKPLH